MKTVTKVIIAVTSVIIWVVCMFIFIPYDMNTVELPDDAPKDFFSTEQNFTIGNVGEKYFENYEEILTSLENQNYKCLTEDESYEILMSSGKISMNGYPLSDSLMGLFCNIGKYNVPDVVFFETEDNSYVLFALMDSEKTAFRILNYSYAIFSVDKFSDGLTQHFFSSTSIIDKPSNYTAIEAMLQSGIVTVIYVIIAFAIALTISTVRYKKSQKGKKLTDDDVTSDTDIKKYIKNKLGAEFFDDEMITVQPCITVEAKGDKAKEFICSVAEKFGVNEIFIGNFFEEKSFIDNESTNAIYIREYLDEDSYSSINHYDNNIVISWIIDGNNAEETAISFYMQELNILIYPARGKLYVFSKDNQKTYNKLITAVNPTDYIMQF